MLTLFGTPKTRALRVTWMLEETGAEYDYVKDSLVRPSAEFLAVNPARKVPALQDGALSLTESAAIVTYLGDKFGRTDLVPDDTALRAKYLQWCFFACAELEQGLWTIGKHKFALPEPQRVPEVIPTAQWEFQRACDLLEQGLGEQAYILGDSFSAADILLAHTLKWAQGWDLLKSEKLTAYMQRCFARPAVKQAIKRENA